jgi:hypothetical protein
MPNVAPASYNLQNLLAYQYQEFLRSTTMSIAAQQISQLERSLMYYAWKQQASSDFNRVRVGTMLKRQAETGINMAIAMTNEGIFDATSVQVASASGQTLDIISRVYKKSLDQRWRQVLKVNQEVASLAIEAMLARYDEKHHAGEPYRANAPGKLKRYAGGVLRNAIAQPSMAEATLNGITFLNTSLLDQYARQWARLNFGAGQAAGGGVANVRPSVKLVAAALEEKGFTGATADLGFKPRGGWVIPKGVWVTDPSGPGGMQTRFRGKIAIDEFENPFKGIVSPDAGQRGNHYFFPNKGLYNELRLARKKFSNLPRGQDVTISRGVAAWGFLESGYASLLRNYPASQIKWMETIFKEAQAEIGAGVPGKFNIQMGSINEAVNFLEQKTEAFIAAGGSGTGGKSRVNFLSRIG